MTDYAVVGGVAAKALRYRFDEITIQRLQESQWWDYNILALLLSGTANPEEFLAFFKLIKHRYLNWERRRLLWMIYWKM